MAERITSFKELKTWQHAQELAVDIYKITKLFPDEEKFGLSNQLRRAAVSIGSNIAEGFSRQSAREKVQFYHIAKGSLTEVESQIDLAFRIGYITESDLSAVSDKSQNTGRLLTALLRHVPSR